MQKYLQKGHIACVEQISVHVLRVCRAKDTIKIVDAEEFATETPERKSCVAGPDTTGVLKCTNLIIEGIFER